MVIYEEDLMLTLTYTSIKYNAARAIYVTHQMLNQDKDK